MESNVNVSSEPKYYDARELGLPKMLLLGLQHLFSSFGATVLVPLIVGLPIQTTIFTAGLGTLIFHIVTGMKVPAFLGSSFAFISGYALISASPTFATMDLNERLAYANGGALVGVTVCYLTLALAIKLLGAKRVLRFLPPVVTGPIIVCIGLTLIPSAIDNAATNQPLALATLLVIVGFTMWGVGIFKKMPILLGIAIPYGIVLVASLLGAGGQTIDFSKVTSAHWLGLPPLIRPKFNIEAIMIMSPICIATVVEHIGDIAAISATTGNEYIKDPGLHRTLIGDFLASVFALSVGGPSNTTYSENTGVLEMTRVYDPRVIRIAAIYAIILAFIPKLSAIIAAIPVAIIGGVSFILYGMIAAIGIRNIVENRVDLKKQRNLIIIAVILACGLGVKDGISFTVAGISITLTGIALAAIVGIAANAILPGADYTFGENTESDSNNGTALKTEDSSR